MTEERDDFADAWNTDNFGSNEDPLGEEPSVEEDLEEPAEEPVEEEAPEEPEEEASSEATQDEIDYREAFLQTQQELKTTIGRLKAAEARSKQAEPAPQAQTAEPTDDEEFLKRFRQEYNDDVLKAVDIMSRRAASELIQNQVNPRFEQLAPLMGTTEELLAQAHFGSIESAHPDVYEIDESPEFNAWISSRPAHIRGAYEFVRERGTPAEVISMLDEYKATMGLKPPAAPAPAKAAAAAAVPRRRGTTPVAPAPSKDDFEAAWLEAPE